ncbi:hypothetical protein SAMN05421846_105144 [Chryseobacterium taeanense]|uniref:Uncharacterized protein n=1 Tax=Chryseobacterium taeanense TaxID=311334 RepID=A0A1G8IY27_9FLAO|nr:hypothetical protein [Chryseobacterium taeanense]SDI23733.1 hypothetical protein SAMN05421846_105144 [Chryseobacterium taeanense]
MAGKYKGFKLKQDKIKIPAGTFIYEGEIAGQGGIYLGGTKQVFISEPWKISGVGVLESYPLK